MRKMIDLHRAARQDMLRRVQQSNLEKSLLFKCVFAAAALIIAANVLDNGPVADKPATFHANV